VPPPSGLPDQYVDFSFPLNGLNLATEYQLQPVQTTRTGLNVRGCEPGTLRMRGGSRNGLTKYVGGPVSGQVGQRVQLLDLIVDPQEANLIGALVQANPPIGSIPDPSSPLASGGGSGPSGGPGTPPPSRPRTPPGGSLTPPGGSGAQPNPHNGQPIKPSSVNLTVGILLSGSGTNYSCQILGGGSIVTASPLSGSDQEVVGEGCAVAIVYVQNNYYFSPVNYQKNP
jgi:hypothetical protein